MLWNQVSRGGCTLAFFIVLVGSFFRFLLFLWLLGVFLGGDKKNTTVGIGDEMAACLGLIVQTELKDLALKGNQVV